MLQAFAGVYFAREWLTLSFKKTGESPHGENKVFRVTKFWEIHGFCLRLLSVAILCVVLFFTATTTPANAQSQFWIQIESQNNIRDTRTRARFFSRSFPETRAFMTTTGWYALVIGPMSEAEANQQMNNLITANRIPRDSFISDGRSHVSQLWPLAANTETTAGSGTVEVTEATIEVKEDAPPALIPDPDLKATRRSEKSWSRDQKKEYQTYMVWTGDYESAIDGSYGRGTRAAIKGFQEREGYKPTGYLTEMQVALLQQRYDESIARLGVVKVRDLDAGIEIEMPGKLVEFSSFEPPFVHYSSKGDSKVRVMLISQSGGRSELRGLYDIMETLDYVPEEGYRARKRDSFVLSGRNDDVVSYTYANTKNGILKGFTLIWKPKIDDLMQPFATIMYNSFTPIEDYVLDETIGYDNGEDGPLDLTSGLETAKPNRSATGFLISAEGVVLTHIANIAECERVTVGDEIDMRLMARNPKVSLAVLTPNATYRPASYALFSDENPEVGTEITVSGYSFPDVMEIATLNFGTLTGTKGMLGNQNHVRISAFLEDGDTGGPVLDDRGAVIGMRLERGPTAQDLPEYVNFALKSEHIMALLDRHSVAYRKSTAFESADVEDVALMAGDFTVKVSCWN